jgi:uncharacterized protein (TIGR00369 family)
MDNFNEENMLTEGRKILENQAFSRYLGAQLEAFYPGGAVLEVPIRDEFMQQYGYVHGGVTSYLADNALTYAAGSVLGKAVITLEYKINYLRPARGEVLVARSSVVSHGRRQAVCRCEVYSRQGAEETLCAVALGTILRYEARNNYDTTGRMAG